MYPHKSYCDGRNTMSFNLTTIDIYIYLYTCILIACFTGSSKKLVNLKQLEPISGLKPININSKVLKQLQKFH